MLNITSANNPFSKTGIWDNITLSQKCDFMMMNKSVTNIELLVNTLGCHVKSNWVKMSASFTVNDDLQCAFANILRWEDFIESKDEEVFYIRNPNVCQLLSAFTKITDNNIIIWKLKDVYIHLNKLYSMLGQFATDRIKFFCIICSIGLPLHKTFTSWQILNQWVGENWHSVNTSEELALLSLRKRLKPLLKKLGTDVHWSQCIDWYRKEYDIFTSSLDNYEQYTTSVNIETYFFEHLYSYPSPDEWTGLLLRLRELLNIGQIKNNIFKVDVFDNDNQPPNLKGNIMFNNVSDDSDSDDNGNDNNKPKSGGGGFFGNIF